MSCHWCEEEPRPAGATLEEIAQTEGFIGHRLPAAFRDLLLIQNGGVSNYTDFERDGECYPLFPVFSADVRAGYGSLAAAFRVREAFDVPDDVVPFAGEGHAWLGLDYRAGAVEPSVVFFCSEDSGLEAIASSFHELLQGLVHREE